MAPSPLIDGYLIRNPRSRALIQAIDRFLSFFTSSSIPKNLPQPRTLLLSNLASLGDVLISTCVIPVIKEAFPQVQLGFLSGSWADAVLKEHPAIQWTHYFDHAYINPKPLSSWQAWREHRKTSWKALQEMKQIGYDWAIDLYCYFPNAIPLLKKANIPIRVGYTSGGFGPLLTHPFAWESAQEYMGFSHLRLLERMGIAIKTASPLPHYPSSCIQLVKDLPRGAIVLHVGSSQALKDWPLSSWKKLLPKLQALGRPLVFTGRGKREKALIEELLPLAPEALNFCDQLSWKEFAGAIQQASLLISADSVAVHLAAAFHIPTVVLFSGINAQAMWVPPHSGCQAVQALVPCSPCFQKHGCATMDCLRSLSVETVFQKVTELVDFEQTNRSLDGSLDPSV